LDDIDGDGDLDAVIVNANSGGRANQGNQIWFNNGQGTFTNVAQGLGNADSQDIALADLNGDGKPDAVVANHGESQVWFNDGTGTFTTGQTLGNSQAVALADVNGDGAIDTVIGSGNTNQVWFNDGQGTFTNTGQSLGTTDSRAIALGDLNGDNQPDAVIANKGANQIWFNDGQGNFSISGQSLGDGDSQDISLGDVNRDGSLDVVSGNNGANEIWLNDGQGNFSNTGQSLGDSNTQAVSLGDVDLDGDVDVVLGNDGPNQLWLNNGSGLFTNSGQSFEDMDSQGIALGDLDNDSDLDSVVGNENNGGNQVLINLNTSQKAVDNFATGQVISFTEGLTVILTIPGGALSQTTNIIYTPFGAPAHPYTETLRFANNAFSLVAEQNGVIVSLVFSKPVTLTIYYESADFDEARLHAYYWDVVEKQWLDATTTCEPEFGEFRGQSYLEIGICHLTEFALFESPKQPEPARVYLPVLLSKK
jgi:hypothetical protein